MITQVHDGISIGTSDDCRPGLSMAGKRAVIHACKFPCWQRFTGMNQLAKDHPNYLMHVYPYDLVLNMIDPPTPLFQRESFVAGRTFGQAHLSRGHQLLIHCNKGESRAPSLALLIMAKDLGAISDDDYDTAAKEFSVLYPDYKPGRGIQQFLQANWGTL